VVSSLDLPRIMFHALRHSHASALIAAGLDVVSVSKRLGHATPTITLNVYSHLFATTDTRAAAAIDSILGRGER
jgi:integrase